jgi:hypothetical protein
LMGLAFSSLPRTMRTAAIAGLILWLLWRF